MKNGKTSSFGFGIIVNQDNEGKTFLGQKGSVSGGSSALLIFPEDKIVIAMSANIGGGSWELPVFEVASIFQNQLHPEKKAKTPVDSTPKDPENK